MHAEDKATITGFFGGVVVSIMLYCTIQIFKPTTAHKFYDPQLQTELFLRALEGENADQLRKYLVEKEGLTFDEADVVLLRVERQLEHLQHADIYLVGFND